MSKEETGIGQNSTYLVTRDELIELLETHFSDRGHIGVFVTTTYGDYHSPTITQTLHLGKTIKGVSAIKELERREK